MVRYQGGERVFVMSGQRPRVGAFPIAPIKGWVSMHFEKFVISA